MSSGFLASLLLHVGDLTIDQHGAKAGMVHISVSITVESLIRELQVMRYWSRYLLQRNPWQFRLSRTHQLAGTICQFARNAS